MMVYVVASTERLLILASAISKSNVLAHGTENIQGMSGLSLCDLSSPSLCFSVGFTGQLLQHGNLRLIVPQLVLLPVKKGDCSSPGKVLGLTLVCVELVVGPNWNRHCGQREALIGQARPGVGGVIPFLPWSRARGFQGKAKAPPIQGVAGVNRSHCLPQASALLTHSLEEEEGTSTATATKGGGAVAENTRPKWAHQREHLHTGLKV